ncbi:MAG: hypothetical protein U0P47_00180 [Acidimicrobiales bacterium]
MGRPLSTDTWRDAPRDRVRVLVECPPENTPDLVAEVLRREGYEVRVCEGPVPHHACPLVATGACNLVSGADVVVNLFGSTDPVRREVLGAITDERRPPAVITEMTTPELERRTESDSWWFDRDRVHIVETPVTAATLIEAVETALRLRSKEPPVSCSGVG